MILAIDTTAEFGSIALVTGYALVEEVPLRVPDGFGHVLFGQIEQLLSRHAVPLASIECFAAAAGPGSFTGVRVGLTAAKGLAEALGKPMIPVSNLEALAYYGSLPLRATVLDARRGEAYAAIYNAALEVVQPETVISFRAWLESLPSGGFEFVAQDFAPFAPALAGTRFMDVPIRIAPRALASAVGHIAAGRLELGFDRALEADANYVRRADAELFWKERGPIA